VQAAAAENPATVGETFIRTVLGDARGTDSRRRSSRCSPTTAPAILAEVTGGPLPVDQAAPVTIDQPTLLVAAAASPEVFLSFSERCLYHLQLALHSEVKERNGD
jgi:hypothetical protein